MPNYRLYHAEDGASITTAGTKIYDLDMSNAISRITMMLKLTSNGSAASTGHPASAITKVEVVDGSQPLFSMSGKQLQALDFFDNPQSGHRQLKYLDNVQCIWMNSINFGRYLWDDQLAFDPRKFVNPQLKITHDYSLGATTPDAATLDVWFQLYDEKQITPAGFLSSREVHSFTASNSAVEYIDLPVDRTIRRLMLQSQSTTKQPYEQYNALRLDVNNDSKILFDESVSDLIKNANYMTGPYVEGLFCAVDGTARTFHITPSYQTTMAVMGNAGTAIYGAGTTVEGGVGSFLGNAASNVAHVISGFCPHGAMFIPMGNLGDPADWLMPKPTDHLRLKITCGSSVGSAAIGTILQQLYRY